ncbi:NeuD/PglB/VioB family sugar acetyltransferase [Rufibacter immobilis]|nr:NeuD/PglB/VioB family sugar acetyltransferase [Rufibacter immobilis]
MMNIEKKICIYGAGGFGRETLCALIDSIAPHGLKIEDVACFMVDDQFYREPRIMGVEVIKRSSFDPAIYDVVVAVGDPAARRKLVEELPASTTFGRVVHPSAVLSQWVDIGEGCIITAGTVLTCNIKIGKHAHLNLHTTIGHDFVAGDFFTTAPAANVSGNCTFGDGVYLGTNVSVREKVTLASGVIIGMGGVVLKDIQEAGVYIGNPVKKLEKK